MTSFWKAVFFEGHRSATRDDKKEEHCATSPSPTQHTQLSSKMLVSCIMYSTTHAFESIKQSVPGERRTRDRLIAPQDLLSGQQSGSQSSQAEPLRPRYMYGVEPWCNSTMLLKPDTVVPIKSCGDATLSHLVICQKPHPLSIAPSPLVTPLTDQDFYQYPYIDRENCPGEATNTKQQLKP
jgi:hypothetical protein